MLTKIISFMLQGNPFFLRLLFGLLVLAGVPGYAQYNIKQIDSILEVVNETNDLKLDTKQVIMVYNASKAINYEKGIAESLVLYSKSSYKSGRYDTAFKYITQAESTSEKINDPVLTFKIRAFKGLCYSRLGFYKEADQTLNSAVFIAKTIADKDEMHYFLTAVYTDLAVNYGRLGNSKAERVWGNKAYNESQKLEKSDKYLSVFAIAISNRGSWFAKHKQNDSAEFYLNKALLLSKKISDKYQYKKYYAQWVINLHAANFYDVEKKFSQAESSYKEAVSAASQIKYALGLKKAYSGLAKVYKNLNQTEKELIYVKKSNRLGDSLASVDKAAIKTPLDYIVRGKDQQLITNRSNYRQIIFIAFLLLSVVTGAVFFYRYKFKREIKLSAEKMNELIRKIELNENKRSPARIEELKGIVQLAINNNPAFLMKFNEFDLEFTPKLLDINPSLIAVEIEFCALLRLNFETKEIARYTNVSVRAVEGKKYRIRKKLNIPTDQDINIWMTHL
ncbi:hypothetical protein [Pedobacter cryoconitis]|uniref:hypothetical protein n=1 Tax=Pedobacter cryoconitis TaxID=188932 RepID=UPI001607FC3D|nr:hypothetical protein [Pedobacter cryoconitis]